MIGPIVPHCSRCAVHVSSGCCSLEADRPRPGRIFGLYTIVTERTCRVYMLFGKVIGDDLDEPGLHFLPASARA